MENPYAKNPYANSGYQSKPPVPGNPRKTEAWALQECARRMEVVRDHYKGKELSFEDREKLRDAVRLNWRLWTIFQAELVEEREDMPEDVRINILTLCQFVDKHTTKFLSKVEPDRLQVLIDINRNIAAGLLTDPKEEEAPAASSAKIG